MHNVSLLTHGIRGRPSVHTAEVGLAQVRAGSHRTALLGATRLHQGLRRQSADNSPSGPSEQTGPDGTFQKLIHSRARGGERNVRRHQYGPRAASKARARAVLAVVAAFGSSVAVVTVAPVAAGAAGIVPPSKPALDIPPQVVPHCTSTPVNDTSTVCIDSVLHNINYARSLEGLGPMVLPSSYASDPVPIQQLIIADEERGDRGLSQFAGLDPALDTAAQTGAQENADPAVPAGYEDNGGGSNFALDFTPLGADFAWMYNDGYGGTNLDCTSPTDPGCWGHRDNILGPWTTTGGQTAQMGDGDTTSGQYTQIFMNQDDPADALVDPLSPSALPTPSTAAAPDVVQVIPASTPSTGAGTPVTIEGNYFNTSSTPQVFFGGVAATNVQVNWDGELSADAPADPVGTATDHVVVTVSTTAGSSSSSGIAQVNEFTYAPNNAPSVTSVSPASGTQIPSGSVTIHGTNLTSGGTQPIVDFGTVASIGSMTYGANQITATIPSAVNPGTVNITVTTPAGTSGVSAADQYTYTGSGATASPAITSANHATFSAGTAGVFDITTTGTPGVSSVSDSAFSGCTPSTLPASITLDYTGGTTATLDGTPQPGDGGTFTVCLTAANGVGPVATQVFTLTVDAPAVTPPRPSSAARHPAPPQHGYWLVGSDGGIFTFGSAQFYGSTGSLHLQRPVVGITPTANRGGYWLVASDGGIFAFGNAGYYGSIPGSGLEPGRLRPAAQLECAHRRHGALHRRRRVFHGGLGRRRLRLRRRPLRGLVPRHRRLQRRCGRRRARCHGQWLLGGDEHRRRLHLR